MTFSMALFCGKLGWGQSENAFGVLDVLEAHLWLVLCMVRQQALEAPAAAGRAAAPPPMRRGPNRICIRKLCLYIIFICTHCLWKLFILCDPLTITICAHSCDFVLT